MRSLSALVAAVAVSLTFVSAVPAAADPPPDGKASGVTVDARPSPRAMVSDRAADRALEHAKDVTSGRVEGDVTLALRDLAVALPRLSGGDRAWARAALKRPPSGNGSGAWTGAEAALSPFCGNVFCVHWTSSGADAPPAVDGDFDGVPDQVETTYDEMVKVWNRELIDLGWRQPVADTSSPDNGGDGKFDVYLSQLGRLGIYGYVTSDDPDIGTTYPYGNMSAFAVLDDDFSTSEYGGSPLGDLQVTAAHEFCHAVQYAYDFYESSWLMEGTATWMEEQVFDGVNQNRAYLSRPRPDLVGEANASYNPLWSPALSLDSTVGLYEYGSWIFYQFTEQYLGDATKVRRIWEWADDSQVYVGFGALQALRRTFDEAGYPFRDAFANWGAWNNNPAAWYAEGQAKVYVPAPAAEWRFGAGGELGWVGKDVRHLATAFVRFDQARSVRAGARLRVWVDGPRTGEARVVVALKDGSLRYRFPDLEADGRAVVTVPFGPGAVRRVSLVLSNPALAGDSKQFWYAAKALR